MKALNVVFEAPTRWDYLTIKRYLKQGVPVWVVEPFHAYHHRKGFRFYPPALPDFVDELINKGEINLLHTNQLNAREIYRLAADSSVNSGESVYSTYKKEYKDLFNYVCKVLKSPKAENIFKKNLCDKLAEFYSLNILLHRVEKVLPPGPILLYPDTNIRDYYYWKSLFSRSNQDFYDHSGIQFPAHLHIIAFFENFKKYIISISRLVAQTMASGLLSIFRSAHKKDRKSYFYGITIISPFRQLTDNKRGPDFIIDDNKVRADNVVYLPLTNLTDEQKNQLKKIPGEVYYPPKAGYYFSHFTEWKHLLILALRKNFFFRAREITVACNAFFNYFSWLKVMESVKIKHFVTHSDFGINHIGRNLALKQAGVETWYFTDSMNFGANFREEENECAMRHPFWSYLNYDHFVTWTPFLKEYFSTHPESFKETHVVGCLWSGHIQGTGMEACGFKKSEKAFTIVALDTTYTKNSFTSYNEGIAFAEHLLQLTDEISDIQIFLKEKKSRAIHTSLDAVMGPRLLDLYDKMASHQRITVCSNETDPSELMSLSDMVVSFPFTSTTFEALSINKPAVWYDPLGYYINTPYAKAGGVTTHSYNELKLKIEEIKSMERGAYKNPFPKDSPLMDPYRDGKAINRFIELLSSHTGHIN